MRIRFENCLGDVYELEARASDRKWGRDWTMVTVKCNGLWCDAYRTERTPRDFIDYEIRLCENNNKILEVDYDE